MTNLLKKAGIGVALGAATIAMTAAPAQAQRYHHYGHYGHYHGSGRTSAALLGGIVGLGVGAAIASDHNRYYDRGYYDNGYYAQPGYYGYRQSYRPRCWTQYRWDPYYGEQVPVQVCR